MTYETDFIELITDPEKGSGIIFHVGGQASYTKVSKTPQGGIVSTHEVGSVKNIFVDGPNVVITMEDGYTILMHGRLYNAHEPRFFVGSVNEAVKAVEEAV